MIKVKVADGPQHLMNVKHIVSYRSVGYSHILIRLRLGYATK